MGCGSNKFDDLLEVGHPFVVGDRGGQCVSEEFAGLLQGVSIFGAQIVDPQACRPRVDRRRPSHRTSGLCRFECSFTRGEVAGLAVGHREVHCFTSFDPASGQGVVDISE